uniref:Uncharacterized protein n=1 Tax=Caenorhabditis japonica TaxID=281687 RepID=A0A8R1EK19_CAEJA
MGRGMDPYMIRYRSTRLRGGSVDCFGVGRRGSTPAQTDTQKNYISNSKDADDTTILVQDPILQKAADTSQNALDLMKTWFDERHLDISAGKSSVTIFTADTKEFNFDPGLTWDGTPIPMQNRTRLLGVEFDTMMKMNGQVAKVSERLAKSNNILRALTGASWGSSKETMLKTFKAIQMAKLERQYIGGLKACCGLTKDTPKELVYYKTMMMPLKEELELGSEQFAISAMRTPGHPAKDLHTRRPAERSSGNRSAHHHWRLQGQKRMSGEGREVTQRRSRKGTRPSSSKGIWASVRYTLR